MNISKTFKMYHNAAVTCVTYLSIGDPYDDPSCIATAAGSMLYAAQAPWLAIIACCLGGFNWAGNTAGTDAILPSDRANLPPSGTISNGGHSGLGVAQVRLGTPVA